MKTPHLYHFDPHEFVRGGRNWLPVMETRLVVLLDVLRDHWGSPIEISESKHALGRIDDSDSWHNINKHGYCYAADIVPHGIEDSIKANHFYMLAESLGFTGIGLYTDWVSTRFGFHLDVRTDRRPGSPATWSRINGTYAALNAALAGVA